MMNPLNISIDPNNSVQRADLSKPVSSVLSPIPSTSDFIAAAVVSSWTWAATLLQSSGVAYRYGVSGPFCTHQIMRDVNMKGMQVEQLFRSSFLQFWQLSSKDVLPQHTRFWKLSVQGMEKWHTSCTLFSVL